MKKAVGCFAIILVMMFVLAGGVYAQTGEIAPDFVLKDLTGQKVSLSSYKGRPVYLVFGATWCPYCVADIPEMTEIHTKYAGKGLVLLNIDIMESREKVLAFANKKKIPYPVLLDEDGRVGERYGVMGVPMKVLIDRAGKIICVNCRSIEEKLLQLMP